MSLSSSAAPPEGISSEESAARAVQKRFEGLIMVRNKAVKGKGAWYWSHLEPLLIHNSDTGLPKSVKLKCCLCNTFFSASNPSRTASEHLKRGTCPNFTSTAPPPPPPPPLPAANHRKRSGNSIEYVSPISVINPQQLALLPGSENAIVVGGGGGGGGGRDEMSNARGMFEDSIKRLKSPKASPGFVLTKSQIDCALDCLGDWVYESCGSVSLSSLENPKFKAFLNQVGLPEVSKREFCGSRLDSRYEDVRNEAEIRVRDCQFFQISTHGWRKQHKSSSSSSNCESHDGNLVNLSVNLPNGTSVYRRAVFNYGQIPSKYAEEILWETISDICGNVAVNHCVGIVSDRFKNSALRNLETQNQWMVNLSCQIQAFNTLINDFFSDLPLFKTVFGNCVRLANFVNNNTPVRTTFHKYQLREYGHSSLLKSSAENCSDVEPVFSMIEDILSLSRVLQLVLLDVVSMEDTNAVELGDMIRDIGFWNDLEAVRSLVRLVKDMTRDFDTERPLVGQCLPIWEDLKSKVKDWCAKFHVSESILDKMIEKRFKKNYHPAWAAAYILDPLYLVKDINGKYLPPFKLLTPDQEKDVDKLITRLVSREEAHVVMMELMKWRTEGLDSVYAQAVQLKQKDTFTGKMKIANPHGSRLVWETYLPEFKSLGKVAIRLIFLHATARGFKCGSSLLKWVRANGRSRSGMDRAQKMLFIAAHSKLERRDFTCDEDKDGELFTSNHGEDDVLNEVFVDP